MCFWSIFLGQSQNPSNLGCRNLNSTSSTGFSGSCENIYNVKKRGYVSLNMNNWGDWGCKSLLFHAKRSSLTDKTPQFIQLKLVFDDLSLAEMLVFKKYLHGELSPNNMQHHSTHRRICQSDCHPGHVVVVWSCPSLCISLNFNMLRKLLLNKMGHCTLNVKN